MSVLDSGDTWLVGIALAAIAGVGGILARDRAQARQLRDADEARAKQIREAEDKLHDRVSRVKEELSQELKALRADFTDYKLQVAREYASVDHLKEVETRLVDAIEKLTGKMDAMPDRVGVAVRQAMSEQ